VGILYQEIVAAEQYIIRIKILCAREKAQRKGISCDSFWISKERLGGIRAEYITVSGKKFKSAVMEYDHTVKIEGQSRPFISRMTFYDELMSSDSTFLAFKTPAFKKLPDYIFNLNLWK